MNVFRSGRLVPFGVPLRADIRQIKQHETLVPQYGITDVGDLAAPPGSMLSAQNLWVRPGAWEPRWRYAQIGTSTPTPDVPNGALQYHDIGGTTYMVVTSKSTVAYLNGVTWTALTYVSGTSNLPPSGGELNRFRGDTVYLPRADANLLLLTNGIDPVFVWAGPSNGTALSTLTEGPIAQDLTVFDNRPVAWNIRELSSSSQLVQRVQWSVKGDPEEWNNYALGAGFEDLLDMRGIGTRIFTQDDALWLFSTEELWYGRKVGLPYVFNFQAYDRRRGLPYSNAAVQTPDGLFWLGPGYMVHRLAGGQIEDVGAGIQQYLRRRLSSPERAFFTYNEAMRQVTLHYSTTVGAYPSASLTFNTLNGQWTPHTLSFNASIGGRFTSTNVSASTTWQQLTGSVASQTATYEELLGGGNLAYGPETDGLCSSTGTVFAASASATSDGGTTPLVEGLFKVLTDSPDRRNFISTVRVEAASPANSTFSIGASGDLGRTVPQERFVTMPAASMSSQYVLHFTVDAPAPAIRLRSSSASTWQIAAISVESRQRGPVR